MTLYTAPCGDVLSVWDGSDLISISHESSWTFVRIVTRNPYPLRRAVRGELFKKVRSKEDGFH